MKIISRIVLLMSNAKIVRRLLTWTTLMVCTSVPGAEACQDNTETLQ